MGKIDSKNWLAIMMKQKSLSDILSDIPPNTEVRDTCFYCGESLYEPTSNISRIYWVGLDGQAIYLHPICGRELGTSLLKDVEELEPKTEHEELMEPTTA